MRSLSSTFALSLLSTAYGSIGPTANLFIENNDISPDGFSRSCVNGSTYLDSDVVLTNEYRAVLAGAVQGSPTFPGPLIAGQKVNNIS